MSPPPASERAVFWVLGANCYALAASPANYGLTWVEAADGVIGGGAA